MVLSYTHPYTNTVRQDRTGTRLCVPFRQSLLSADGSLMAPQLATKSIPLLLAAMPLTGLYSQAQHHLVYAFDILFYYSLKSMFCVCFSFPSCQILYTLKLIQRNSRPIIGKIDLRKMRGPGRVG